MSSLRALRAPARLVPRFPIGQRASRLRFQSTSSNAGSTSSSHIVTGIASGTTAALVGYGIFTLTPTGRVQRRLNSVAYEADKTYKNAATQLQQNTPNTQQAIDYLRETTYSYAAFVPGGRGYVDTAFNDLDTLRESHGEEVDKIISETYQELKEISKEPLNSTTLSKALDVIRSFARKIGQVTADGFSDLLDNHPQLKEKLGPSVDQLKQLGDSLGPQVRKEVDQTWNQVSQMLQEGFTVQNVQRARDLVQKEVENVKKLGDKAWKEGMEQTKPILDDNPNMKQLIEENADVLKQGNAARLFQKVKDSAQSGNSKDLHDYVNRTVDKVRQGSGSSFGGFEKYLSMIPGGSELVPKLSTISNLSEQDTQEARDLMKETADQLRDVLSKQSQKAEDLLRKSQK